MRFHNVAKAPLLRQAEANTGLWKKPRAGGAEEDRTPDLCSAIAALSHLSYSPRARGGAPLAALSHPCNDGLRRSLKGPGV